MWGQMVEQSNASVRLPITRTVAVPKPIVIKYFTLNAGNDALIVNIFGTQNVVSSVSDPMPLDCNHCLVW